MKSIRQSNNIVLQTFMVHFALLLLHYALIICTARTIYNQAVKLFFFSFFVLRADPSLERAALRPFELPYEFVFLFCIWKAYLSKEELEVPPRIAWFFPTHQDFSPHLRATVVSQTHGITRLAKAPTKKWLAESVGTGFEPGTFRSRVRRANR